ncbi:hypothetical protein [Pseudobdellovibrio exovorus]|uniref:Uncharacterized protein n=1 Tax=Pseudobdellovibrio exovorus JSS TaxID=1184267 RepID=M4V5M9_9BACT|nr:hypothetical protein [Pseudobdellovibrio exovorus]AGH94468.1 hypothetical protein A11Q_248 [Pseudobdellovibrio exovorus JSS]
MSFLKNLSLVLAFFASVVLTGTQSLAHGEDQEGPHGGHIQMPASFHTEVIPDKDGSFHIFLLDMNFKNPTIKDSEIQARITSGKKTTQLQCNVMGNNHFHCLAKGNKTPRTGILFLKAKREGVQAQMEAQYKLPLKPFKSEEAAKSGAEPKTESKAHHH